MIQRITDLWDLARGTIRERAEVPEEEPLLADNNSENAGNAYAIHSLQYHLFVRLMRNGKNWDNIIPHQS